MEDEIKEKIDDIFWEVKKYSMDSDYLVKKEEMKLLLDYITNLQTIEQQYSAILSENAELENKITNLQERCEYLEKSNNRREDEIMSLRDECVDGETYKSRNEKAIENIDLVIELIKQQPTEDDTWILNRLNGFKYLLQGDEKE